MSLPKSFEEACERWGEMFFIVRSFFSTNSLPEFAEARRQGWDGTTRLLFVSQSGGVQGGYCPNALALSGE